MIGNGVATIVVARWEGAVDMRRLRQHLNEEAVLEADEPEKIMA